MKRHSPWLFTGALLCAIVGLHFWFNGSPPRPAGERVETVGQLCLMTDRHFYHEGQQFQVVHAYLEYPYSQVDFITSPDQVNRLDVLRGKRIRLVTLCHEGKNGHLISVDEAP